MFFHVASSVSDGLVAARPFCARMEALRSFDIDRDEDRLQIVRINFQHLAGGVQSLGNHPRLLVSIDQLVQDGLLDRSLGISLQEACERRSFCLGVGLCRGILIGIILIRGKADLAGVLCRCLRWQLGRASKANNCQCHRRCKD
jgi:hypothetical protein